MNRYLILWAIVGLVTLQGCASMVSPWMVNKASDSRFIPVEMWTGADWKGERQLAMTPANTTFGARKDKTITGPMPWTHPITGETLQVYERINPSKKGDKRQLFTINPDGSGLAKVYDERPNLPTRFFSSQAVMFPLGHWRKGEKRIFTFDEFVDGKSLKRTVTIHVRRLSFTYKKVKYAIKYDYLMHDDSGRIVFHERFIYGPGKSLMYYKNRL
ncbi:hypothetical protein [Desulfosarcina sp.]|uniref:hypothetical protein n=1 Tax=Desulfosarcina sp. TaxID=2027861 RepID=UPI0029AB2CFD|nr:hypothetical protein [Desulfosarcina sp.]MDX2455426.1 hypothetical protein [Desulfosarcina sp.]MDX2492925.1 hypothetical protein [Desulfosarcina sp.]